MTGTQTTVGRRQRQRRRGPAAHMPANAMRCCGCGTVWYSRIADMLVTWARCARCDGELHTERREGSERRRDAWLPADTPD